MKTRILLYGLLYGACVHAQVTGVQENFADGVLTGWETQNPATFSLQERDSLLHITYTRTTASWEWDNFNFTPPGVEIAHTPRISFLAKSTVATVLTLKPVYADNRSDWLQVNLPADRVWRPYNVSLSTSGSTQLVRIYFYLDGGSMAVANGTVYFDDLCIGDSAKPVNLVRRDKLEAAIAAAAALAAGTQEGTWPGQYPVHSKSALFDALDQARASLNNRSATQSQIDEAVWLLYDACVCFEGQVQIANPGLNDAQSTAKTRYLYANLAHLSGRYLAFGMHDPTGYGVGWSGDDNRSDVKDVCGDYPAVSAWDLNGALQDDEAELMRFRYRILSAYQRGGINSLCWHQYDPEGKSFYAADLNYAVVPTLLVGGKYHTFYKERLRRVALFFKALRDEDGQSIPILFRPFHEHDGNWFWWGAGPCNTADYNALWRFTCHFLRDSLNVHNLIYILSPSSFNTTAEYLKIYPGDDQIDILGMDFYFSKTISLTEQGSFTNRLRITAGLSVDRRKLPALTEVGQEALPTIDWFTNNLLPPLRNDSLASKIIYAAVWRNASTAHHYAPYPGHPSAADFIDFYNDPATLFEKDLPELYAPVAADDQPPLFTQMPQQPHVATDTVFTLYLQTDEQASLRYSAMDQAYAHMPHSFQIGQGGRDHRTLLHGIQGQTDTFYIRALDLAGNESASLKITATVDTLQRPIPWYSPLYRLVDWPQGPAPLGYNSSDNATTTTESKTVYLYKIVNLEQIPASLRILIRCHDGAAVFCNGVEVGRVNMNKEGALDFQTQALNGSKNSLILTFSPAAMKTLRVGDNLLCAEVHMAGVANADISFDARLFMTGKIFFELGSVWHYYATGEPLPVIRLQDVMTAVGAHAPVLSATAVLEQNYPNPFNPQTCIRYQLPQTEQVRLRVYDIRGRLALELVNQRQNAGAYAVLCDGHNLAAGVYLYCLQTGACTKTAKMILLR